MWLHFAMLTVHVVVQIIAQIFVFRAFENPTTENLLLQTYFRIAMSTSQMFVQAVMIYVLIAVNKAGVENGEMRRPSSLLDEDISGVHRT